MSKWGVYKVTDNGLDVEYHVAPCNKYGKVSEEHTLRGTECKCSPKVDRSTSLPCIVHNDKDRGYNA